MKLSLKQPAISIVMPLYNKEREVARSIKSVLSQSFTDFEVVVVNDGSTDNGPGLVRKINDHRIRIIDQPNAGVSAARNRGIAEALADLIAFLDADDEWDPDFLDTVIQLHDKFPECDVFATNYSFRRANNYTRLTVIRGLPDGFSEGILTDYFWIAAQSDPPIWSSAVAVTKKSIESVGSFPVGVTAGEDLLAWAKLAVRYDIAFTIVPKAHFWEPVELSDRPGRIPDEPDTVGQDLKGLINYLHANRRQGLKSYIALWHKMRASIYMRLGNRSKALKEIKKAVYHSRFKLTLIVYIALVFLPKKVFINLLKFKRH